MKLYILISLYFIVNSFFAGRQYATFQESKTGKELIGSILVLIVSFLFGSVLMIINALCGIVVITVRTVQPKLWFYYFFTKDFDNMPIDKLEAMNRIAAAWEKEVNNKLAQVISKLAVKLINKRNNYTPQQAA